MTSTHERYNGQCQDLDFQQEDVWEKSPLWSVLLGHKRETLDEHLTGLQSLLVTLYQTHRQFNTIEHVVEQALGYKATTVGLVCKRAQLLLAIHTEHEIAAYFIEEERKLGQGVGPTRVTLLLLDALIPMYLAEFAQDPDILVRRCTHALTMGFGHELWERMSNAYRDAAVHCAA